MLTGYVSTVVTGINMKLIDNIKAWVKSAPSKVVAFLKRVKSFIIRHAMIMIFIVFTSGWVYFFPQMDPERYPHLAFLLTVAFLLGTMRDHEVWWRQRIALEKEIEVLKSMLSKKKK
jgi:hypothetical protein